MQNKKVNLMEYCDRVSLKSTKARSETVPSLQTLSELTSASKTLPALV
jgi:hypothetical protein